MNLWLIIPGALAVLIGLGLLVPALRARSANEPKSTAMLIAGMMVTAFGLLLAGFAVGLSTSAPLALNPEPVQ